MQKINDRLSISEMAALCGIPPKTLRYYDDIDLLKPFYRDEQTSYRYYDRSQLEQVLLLQSLKALGMSLADIRRELHQISSARYATLLKEHVSRIDEEILQLQRQKQDLNEWISEIDEALSAEKETPFFRSYPAVNGYLFPCRTCNRSEHELAMRQLEQLYGNGAHVGRIRRITSAEDLKAGRFKIESGFFIPETSIRSRRSGMITLPAAEFAVMFTGTNLEEDPDQWSRLLRFVREQHYEICGDGLRSIPIELGISRSPEDYVTRLAVPVRPIV